MHIESLFHIDSKEQVSRKSATTSHKTVRRRPGICSGLQCLGGANCRGEGGSLATPSAGRGALLTANPGLTEHASGRCDTPHFPSQNPLSPHAESLTGLCQSWGPRPALFYVSDPFCLPLGLPENLVCPLSPHHPQGLL